MRVEGKAFERGQSGNPSARLKGARNHTTRAVEAILDDEAEALTRKAVEMALGGDGPALRLCLDRLCPPRKDRVVQFDMPVIEKIADVPNATAKFMQAVADGELTPSEARDVSAASACTLRRSRRWIWTGGSPASRRRWGMYSKVLKTRLAKIVANPRFGTLSGLSDAELDRQIVLGLNDMAAEWPSFGAMVTNLRESPMPADMELAGQIDMFIADWQAQQRPKAV